MYIYIYIYVGILVIKLFSDSVPVLREIEEVVWAGKERASGAKVRRHDSAPLPLGGFVSCVASLHAIANSNSNSRCVSLSLSLSLPLRLGLASKPQTDGQRGERERGIIDLNSATSFSHLEFWITGFATSASETLSFRCKCGFSFSQTKNGVYVHTKQAFLIHIHNNNLFHTYLTICYHFSNLAFGGHFGHFISFI